MEATWRGEKVELSDLVANEFIPKMQERKEQFSHSELYDHPENRGVSSVCGYLLGHLDGTSDEVSLEALCPALASTPYLKFLQRAQLELREIWDARGQWTTRDEVFAKLQCVVEDAMAAGGIFFEAREDGSIYVRVPFSADTMPDPV
jgi:hypothetical protein